MKLNIKDMNATILTKSIILIVSLTLFNAFLWMIAFMSFNKKVLSLCLLAWTLGLKHGLDCDHIAAIDNCIRTFSSKRLYPTTIGFAFSLGHSTIVILANVVLIISMKMFDKINDIGDFGGLVG